MATITPRSYHRIVSKNLSRIDSVIQKRASDAAKVPLAKKSNVSDIETVKTMVQSLSLGYRKDQRIIEHVKANVKKHTPEIFAIRKLPNTIIPSDFYPSAAKLQQSCSNKKHSVGIIY